MTDDLAAVRRYKEENAKLAEENARLKTGGGGGTSDTMEGRVTRLEVEMEHLREDVGEVKTDLKAVLAKINELPTKRDLDTWRWQWLATGIAIVALTVGGITGGLALIASHAG